LSPTLPAFTNHFSTLAAGYDVALCDVWGVVHNGVAASAEAGDALMRFRAGGGTVVLITNAPRPQEVVRQQLDRFGVARGAYDAIVSSGDVTRTVVTERAGQTVFHIGPDRDRGTFAGLDVSFAPVEAADYALCSGLFDDDAETPDDYRALLERLRERALLMVCANPDMVVERGDRLVYCAGAIADLYQTLGGEVLYAGKPHRPIYDCALGVAQALRGAPIARDRVLAIGDSVRTDLAGAASFSVDFLFVTAGIHAVELGSREEPDPQALRNILAGVPFMPRAVMRRLAW
jgi:HAD superfamily hydrolase (TIGR01459 family)